MIEERALAEKGVKTEDCRWGDCQSCGLCDFTTLKPIVHPEVFNDKTIEEDSIKHLNNVNYKILAVSYSKLGPARHLGHLEMVKIIQRAIRRAQIPVKMSEGFHPMPRISFENPLPLGMESEKEYFYMSVPDYFDPDIISEQLNHDLTEGLTILDSVQFLKTQKFQHPREISYEVILNDCNFSKKNLIWFFDQEEALIQRTTKKGNNVTFDLRKLVSFIDLKSENRVIMTIKTDHGRLVRPVEVIKQIFGILEDSIRKARIIKRATIGFEDEIANSSR